MTIEQAIYTDTVVAIAEDILKLLDNHMADIPPGSLRSGILGAALGSAANLFDNSMFDPLGATGALARCADSWRS